MAQSNHASGQYSCNVTPYAASCSFLDLDRVPVVVRIAKCYDGQLRSCIIDINSVVCFGLCERVIHKRVAVHIVKPHVTLHSIREARTIRFQHAAPAVRLRNFGKVAVNEDQ
jgi:hypothetical protein